MTIQEFNALPEEARRFIETHAGCLSCGNTAIKLDRAYELYLQNRKMRVYQIKGGGVNYATEDGQKGVLYGIKTEDSPLEIREKLKVAAILFEKAPQYFLIYDERAISDLLESLPAEEVIDLNEVKEEPKKSSKKAVTKSAIGDDLM